MGVGGVNVLSDRYISLASNVEIEGPGQKYKFGIGVGARGASASLATQTWYSGNRVMMLLDFVSSTFPFNRCWCLEWMLSHGFGVLAFMGW